MDLKQELISAAGAYCDQAGISKARLATIVANDGKFFERIEGGGGFTVSTFERFMAYFRDNPASERRQRRQPVGAPAAKRGCEAPEKAA